MKKNIFLGLLLLMISKVYSQIIYTPVTPNFEINITSGSQANLFPIDFNNDGIVDFNFRWDVYGFGQYFMHITSSNSFSYNPNNQVIGTESSNSFGVPYAMPLDFGTSIAPSSTGWITEQRGPLIGDGESANFLNLGDKYIGVRFIAAGQLYYGWILVSFTTNKLTIKSYAYQSTANTTILAGDTGSLSAEDVKLADKIKVFPNPASEYVKISGFKNEAEYKIYNVEGKIIKQGTADSRSIIDISHFAKGIYIISLENKDKQHTVKFIKD